MHSLTECRTNAQASRAPGDLGKLTGPGTESVFEKRHSDPSALYGTIFCSRNTIRFATSTVARPVAGTDSGLLDCDRVEHPTAHCPRLAKRRAALTVGVPSTLAFPKSSPCHCLQ